MSADDDLYAYTIPEVAVRLSCSPRTVYALLAAGRLWSVKLGGEQRIPAAAIRDFLAGDSPHQGRTRARVTRLA